MFDFILQMGALFLIGAIILGFTLQCWENKK
jgi:hypothetical protein